MITSRLRCFACATLFALAAAGVSARTPGEVEVGGTLRDTPMKSFAGGTRKFADFRGKPMIINVWASWCGPCRAEMDGLERLAKRYNGRQLTIIGVSTDDDGQAAAAYLRRAGVSFENFLDNNLVLENMLGADKLPLTLLIDANGRVLRKIGGARAWDSPEALQFISAVLQVKL